MGSTMSLVLVHVVTVQKRGEETHPQSGWWLTIMVESIAIEIPSILRY
jgi:hypothetical protein